MFSITVLGEYELRSMMSEISIKKAPQGMQETIYFKMDSNGREGVEIPKQLHLGAFLSLDHRDVDALFAFQSEYGLITSPFREYELVEVGGYEGKLDDALRNDDVDLSEKYAALSRHKNIKSSLRAYSYDCGITETRDCVEGIILEKGKLADPRLVSSFAEVSNTVKAMQMEIKAFKESQDEPSSRLLKEYGFLGMAQKAIRRDIPSVAITLSETECIAAPLTTIILYNVIIELHKGRIIKPCAYEKCPNFHMNKNRKYCCDECMRKAKKHKWDENGKLIY